MFGFIDFRKVANRSKKQPKTEPKQKKTKLKSIKPNTKGSVKEKEPFFPKVVKVLQEKQKKQSTNHKKPQGITFSVCDRLTKYL